MTDRAPLTKAEKKELREAADRLTRAPMESTAQGRIYQERDAADLQAVLTGVIRLLDELEKLDRKLLKYGQHQMSSCWRTDGSVVCVCGLHEDPK